MSVCTCDVSEDEQDPQKVGVGAGASEIDNGLDSVELHGQPVVFVVGGSMGVMGDLLVFASERERDTLSDKIDKAESMSMPFFILNE